MDGVMQYLLCGLSLLAIILSIKYFCDFVRAIRYQQWKKQRDKLSSKQFIQSLETEYFKAKMKDLYK
jgi:hypothetical protein